MIMETSTDNKCIAYYLGAEEDIISWVYTSNSFAYSYSFEK